MSQASELDFSISTTHSTSEQTSEHIRMSSLTSGELETDPPSVSWETADRKSLVASSQATMPQKGCCLYFKMVWCTIGALGGLIIFFMFFIDYKNYHGASWGFMGGVMAGAALHLHILYFGDRLDDWHDRTTLTKIMYLGFVVFVLSTVAIVTYISLAYSNKQTYELDGNSYYPAATFSFYSIKWSLTLMWEARQYRYLLSLANPVLIPGMTSYSTSLTA